MDPAEIVRTHRDRLTMVHLKDVREDAADAARVSRAALRGRKYLFCEVGRGVIDFAAFDKALREVQYRGWLMVELDANEPEPGGPDEGARVNRDALRKLGWLAT
jgi:inosose dehydratase